MRFLDRPGLANLQNTLMSLGANSRANQQLASQQANQEAGLGIRSQELDMARESERSKREMQRHGHLVQSFAYELEKEIPKAGSLQKAIGNLLPGFAPADRNVIRKYFGGFQGTPEEPKDETDTPSSLAVKLGLAGAAGLSMFPNPITKGLGFGARALLGGAAGGAAGFGLDQLQGGLPVDDLMGGVPNEPVTGQSGPPNNYNQIFGPRGNALRSKLKSSAVPTPTAQRRVNRKLGGE